MASRLLFWFFTIFIFMSCSTAPDFDRNNTKDPGSDNFRPDPLDQSSLVVTIGENSSIELNWRSDTFADGYQIQKKLPSETEFKVIGEVFEISSFVDESDLLFEGTEYRVFGFAVLEEGKNLSEKPITYKLEFAKPSFASIELVNSSVARAILNYTREELTEKLIYTDGIIIAYNFTDPATEYIDIDSLTFDRDDVFLNNNNILLSTTIPENSYSARYRITQVLNSGINADTLFSFNWTERREDFSFINANYVNEAEFQIEYFISPNPEKLILEIEANSEVERLELNSGFGSPLLIEAPLVYVPERPRIQVTASIGDDSVSTSNLIVQNNDLFIQNFRLVSGLDLRLEWEVGNQIEEFVRGRKVYRSTNGDNFELIDSTFTTDEIFIDQTALRVNEYSYRVGTLTSPLSETIKTQFTQSIFSTSSEELSVGYSTSYSRGTNVLARNTYEDDDVVFVDNMGNTVIRRFVAETFDRVNPISIVLSPNDSLIALIDGDGLLITVHGLVDWQQIGRRINGNSADNLRFLNDNQSIAYVNNRSLVTYNFVDDFFFSLPNIWDDNDGERIYFEVYDDDRIIYCDRNGVTLLNIRTEMVDAQLFSGPCNTFSRNNFSNDFLFISDYQVYKIDLSDLSVSFISVIPSTIRELSRTQYIPEEEILLFPGNFDSQGILYYSISDQELYDIGIGNFSEMFSRNLLYAQRENGDLVGYSATGRFLLQSGSSWVQINE